jgi:hypothetical protein
VAASAEPLTPRSDNYGTGAVPVLSRNWLGAHPDAVPSPIADPVCDEQGETMKTYEFWRELATGEIWAVELLDGVVVGSAGPLDHSDVEERYLRVLDYRPGRAAWIEANRDRFGLYSPEHAERPR